MKKIIDLIKFMVYLTIDSALFGKFEKQKHCKCEDDQIKIIDLNHRFCPMMNSILHFFLNICSKLRGGVRKLLKRDPQWNCVHAFVELSYECSTCKKKGKITIDYAKKDGVKLRFGSFTRPSWFVFREEENAKGLNLKKVRLILEQLKNNGFDKTEYHLFNNNCQKFAKEMYNVLKKKSIN